MKEPKLRFPEFTGTWEQRKLGECAEFNPKSELPDIFEYVDLESVVGTNILSHRTENKSSAPSRAQRLAQKGDVFYQTVRPYQKNNCIFEKDDNNWVFSTGYAQLRPVNNGYFLLTLLQNEDFVKLVLDRCTGTSYPAINSNDLADIDVNIPSDNKEQQKIGTYFKNLDNLIQSAEKELEGYRELKQGMLQKMFPKNGEKVPEIRFPEFTGDWEQHRLSEICGQLKNTINPMDTPDDYYMEYSMPAFDDNETATCAMGKTMNSARKVIDKPCLLVNKLNVRKKRIWNVENPESNAVCSAEFVPLYSLGADLTFVKYTLFTDYFTSYLEGRSSGSSNSQKRVTPDVIMQAKVTIPTCDEQKKIGEYFSNLDNLITLQQQELDGYKELKKGLLQQMFC